MCKPQDEALATRILQALAGKDREVIMRFYLDYQKPEDIERDMGLRAGHVNQLRASVKAKFLAERDRTAWVFWRDHATAVWRRCARYFYVPRT